jgi:phosphate acyltransferase
LSGALTIAVDAMGGDFAPQQVIAGSVRFLRSCSVESDGVRLLLVGDPDAIQACLKAEGAENESGLSVVAATQVIGMEEHPLESVRKKPDASISVCAKLVKSREADATMSAGNTGACLVAAMMLIERLPEISRAPIATFMPSRGGGATLIVDAGANVDCQPSHLADFALLGSLYMEKVAQVARPRVALLSNGEEDGKGNELVKRSRALLEALPVNFIGNVEGNTLFEDFADVAVCDGFAGNVSLKTAEGMGTLALSILEEKAQNAGSEIERLAIEDAIVAVRRRVDWAEYGGAPLLGIDGVSIIAHGRSDARAIASALGVASRTARSGYVDAVKTALKDRAL